MSSKTVRKENLKKERAKLYEKLSSLKTMISDFKVERKANWKVFKNAIKDEVSQLKKSIHKLSIHKLNKQMKSSLPTNGSAHGKVTVNEIG